MEQLQPVIVSYPPNPHCHGNMMLYEATMPSVFEPKALVYRCFSCRGQATTPIKAVPVFTYRKGGKYYMPPQVDAVPEELGETE